MRDSQRKYIKLLVVGAIIIVVFLVPQSRHALGNGFFYIAKPILLAGSEGKEQIQNFSDFLRSYASLVRENRFLKEDNSRVQAYRVENELLKREKEASENAISFVRGSSYVLTETRVVGSYSDPSGLALVINGGNDAGIVSGSLVITGDRILVGRVEKVFSDYSIVGLSRNEGVTLSVTVIPARGETGTSTPVRRDVEGLFVGKSDHMIVDLIPKDADVREGDAVVTNGFGENAIRNLLVGEVAAVAKSDAKVFQEVSVRELIPFRFLDTVFVIGKK